MRRGVMVLPPARDAEVLDLDYPPFFGDGNTVPLDPRSRTEHTEDGSAGR